QPRFECFKAQRRGVGGVGLLRTTTSPTQPPQASMKKINHSQTARINKPRPSHYLQRVTSRIINLKRKRINILIKQAP
ncbi:MAG: hypothetical protein ACYTGQ_10300, partial [Planctomycetota bacterium]